MNRRTFFASSLTAAAGATLGVRPVRDAEAADAGQAIPLKIGIRAASMKLAGNIDVIRAAARITGLMGVELQATAGSPNLRDWETVRRYKREADRWAMRIPSLAGVWDRGVEIRSPAAAESIRLSIRAAEILGSNTLLLAFFKAQAPDMSREDSYGPLVAMLREVAPRAADAGVTLGLENSLSPADNMKLVDLVAHSAVRVYYDVHNMAFYGHGEQAVSGIRLLGRERLCAVHVKNDSHLIEEPGPIDWPAAFRAFTEIGYEGWYVYETSHATIENCIEDTKRNNVFLRHNLRMPVAESPK